MAKINLRDFYPWYTHDEFVEVPDVIAAELLADRRYHKSHAQRIRRNKAFYSLDAEDGIETAAVVKMNGNPEAMLEIMDLHCRICRALNSLPARQGRRIEAHYIRGKSQQEIADAEGVDESAVRSAVKRGVRTMQNNLKEFF